MSVLSPIENHQRNKQHTGKDQIAFFSSKGSSSCLATRKQTDDSLNQIQQEKLLSPEIEHPEVNLEQEMKQEDLGKNNEVETQTSLNSKMQEENAKKYEQDTSQTEMSENKSAVSNQNQINSQPVNYKNAKEQQNANQIKEMTIYKGVYSKNRVYLHGWLKNQCRKFKINTQTYANSLALMEIFYKYNEFDQKAFIKNVLCLIIISSKALQPRVLYTSTIAKNNNFDFQQTLQVEMNMLAWFEYKISTYNFVRVVTGYMKRWDLQMSKIKSNVLFSQESYESYKLYLEMFHLCENHLRLKGALLQKTIKKIFHFVLNRHCKTFDCNNIIDLIFKKPYTKSSQQLEYAYELLPEEEEAALLENFEQWETEFAKLVPEIQKKYRTYQNERKNYKTYGQFLSLLF